MEKHGCKICHRKFINGKALGGHMKSHMMNLPIIPKIDEFQANDENESFSSLADSPSSSDDDDDGEEEVDEKGVTNSKKRVKLSDLEDRESETESTRNPTRRRSKRLIKPRPRPPRPPRFSFKGFGYGSDINEGEPISSISEVASEEDVAFCLMMLSRDKWTTCHERDFGDIINSFDDVTHKVKRFRCETCNKVFRSYQALGGHRSSHKKTRLAAYNNNNNDNNDDDNTVEPPKKIHECPVCFRVFQSGQALGGHKRSHGIITSIENNNQQQPLDEVVNDHQSINKLKRGNIVIDLNLPAPIEDEEISQIDNSAVFDTHF